VEDGAAPDFPAIALDGPLTVWKLDPSHSGRPGPASVGRDPP